MGNLTVITPTIGRPSLESTIQRCSELLLPGDLHIVGIDAPNTEECRREAILKLSLPLLQTISVPVLRAAFGNAVRDMAISMATAMDRTGYFVFCDDDDLPHPDGIAYLHELEPDGKMHCFLSTYGGITVGHARSLALGNIAGGRICPPLAPDMPKWMHTNVREADFFFANACVRKFGEPIWHDIPIIDVDAKESKGHMQYSRS